MFVFDLKMFITFVNGVKLPEFCLCVKFKFLNAVLVFFWGKKLKGSHKVELLVAFNLDHLQQKSPK